MKKYTLASCLIILCITTMPHAQTSEDLSNVVHSTGNRTLSLTNNVIFDFGRYGTDFDDGGELTLKGNVDTATNNPADAFTLTSSSGAFLEVFDTSTLNLTNIKMSGNTSTGTNFISNNGTLNITNSIISNNLNGQGSSVISNTGNLFIDSSLFENNTVAITDTNPSGLGRGGAIRNEGYALITNSVFRTNGSQHGSAIYNIENGTMEIIGSTFTDNSNTNSGSGYAYGSIYNKGELIVRDSIFENNTMGSGGAIYNEGITTIYNSEFLSNTANGLGGALANATGGTLTVYNSTFDANEGSGASAAINSAHGGNLNIIGTTIKNHTVISDFDSGNYDRDTGGAIYFYGQQYHWDENDNYVETIPTGHLYIQDSHFLNNTVSRGGGAIYNAGYATIINTVFDGNVASLEQDLVGSNDAATAGAFYDYNQTDMPTIIKDSKFLNSTAYSAGAIYHPTGHLIIDNTLFDNNSAISVGSAGALQNGGANSYLDITNSTFSNNYAGHGGAIFHQSKNAMNISGTVFDGNIAESFAGAFYAYTHEIVKGDASTAVQNYTGVTNSTFQNNNAGRGGAIYALSKVDVVNSLFENNSADGGGAIYVGSDNYFSGIVTIHNSSFIGNSAGSGGALSNNGTLTITDSIFEKNTGASGSAILSNGNVNIYNSVFTNNVSTYSTDYTYATGTGVIDGNGIINMYNSSITNNYHSSNNTNDYSGAITGRGTVNIIANNGVSMLSGNVSSGNSSSLFVRSNSEMNLFAGNNGTITINDAITLNSESHLNINKENAEGFSIDGIVEINDEVKHAGGAWNSNFHVNFYNGILKFGSATVNYDLDGDGIGDGDSTSHGTLDDRVSLNIYGGKLSTVDGNIVTTNVGKLNLFSDVLYDLDVDLANKKSDRLSATSFDSNDNKFVVDTIYLQNDASSSTTDVAMPGGDIPFVLAETTTEAYSSIAKYSIDDSKFESHGILQFSRDENNYKDYNSSLYATTVALLTGSHLSNALLSKLQLMNENTFSTDYRISVLPYYSSETITLDKGYTIDTAMYGSSILFDFNQYSAISLAYTGSQQTYESNTIVQNGVQIAGSFYKSFGNCYVNSNISFSGTHNGSNTSYGYDSFPLIVGGLTINTGYIFSINDNAYIIEPSILASYNFSKAFDYVTENSITISTQALHIESVEPTVTFIKPFDRTLQASATIKASFNFMQGGQVKANQVTIPSMGINPYIEYGLGIEKIFQKNVLIKGAISGYALSRFGLEALLSVSYSF